MNAKPLHKLEPQGVIRPRFTFNSYEHFLLMPNGSMRSLKGKTFSVPQ